MNTFLRPLSAAALFLMCVAATLTIWIRSPFVSRVVSMGFECGVLALGAAWCLPAWTRWHVSFAALSAISLWGFVQLALGATVYRYATVDASLRFAALASTAWIAACSLERNSTRTALLRGFAWFGFLVSIFAVLEYYTSSGKVFWFFPSGYPDAWGPFLSRNNFAEFLELALPVALWLSATEDRALYNLMAAVMLAAGLASASRAGAVLLALETIAVFGILRRRPRWQWIAATAACVAVAGAGELGRRILQPNPLQYRREMAHSALSMIADHPWRGFGLGTFETVYPAYAEFDSGTLVDHAHNDWLEWASEGGLPFAAVWAVLALSMLRPAIRSVWGLGIPAIFLHALVDYPFARFGLTAWVFALIGALLACRSGREEFVQPAPLPSRFGIGTSCNQPRTEPRP